MSEILLEARALNVWFDQADGPELHAVRGIDLTLRAGQRTALIGESGCGKSTTLHALLGLLPESAIVGGEIEICGEPALTEGEQGFRHHRWTDVAMVFQGAMNAMNPVHTVGRQLEEVLALRGGIRGDEARERVRELLELVGLLGVHARAYPHQLSGGMRQRACIAMALACRPKVLLADEPTTALDAIVATEIASVLSGLCDELGLALLLVSHDVGLACATCDEMHVMYEGKVLGHGAPQEVIDSAEHPYMRELFDAVADLTDARVSAPEGSGEQAEPVLTVEGLVVEYEAPRTAWQQDRTPVCAVDDVTLEVNLGEFVALIGESGSGKTSLAQSVLRMTRFKSGRVLLDGGDVGAASGRELRDLRRRAQMIFQDPYGSLDPRMTVHQLVEEPLAVHGEGDREGRHARVVEALTAAGLTPPERYLLRYPHQLSGGERQRVALASAIVVRPQLIIADEPVSMLDVSLRAGILQLLDDLRREYRLSLLMITHDIATAMRHADRVVVMRAGRIVETGPTHEVVARPRHEYTRALLSAVPQRHPRSENASAVPQRDPRSEDAPCP